MKNLFLILFFFLSTKAYSEGVGVEGGVAYGDIGAEETAQRIANISGSTTTVTYDQATWYGRIFYEYDLSKETFLDFGYFLTEIRLNLMELLTLLKYVQVLRMHQIQGLF